MTGEHSVQAAAMKLEDAKIALELSAIRLLEARGEWKNAASNLEIAQEAEFIAKAHMDDAVYAVVVATRAMQAARAIRATTPGVVP